MSATARRPIRIFRNMAAKIAAIPMVLTALCVFLGGTIWTIVYSFTSSKLLPRANWVGFDQYERLWGTNRWARLDREPDDLRALFARLQPGDRLCPCGASRPEDPVREYVQDDHSSPVRTVLHRHGAWSGSGS